MAFSRSFLAALVLLSLLLLHVAEAQLTGTSEAPAPSPSQKLDCGKACEGRCKSSKRPNLCKRSCGSCCHECNCVPPGTYGNYDVCPCYGNRMTEKNGKTYRKCP